MHKWFNECVGELNNNINREMEREKETMPVPIPSQRHLLKHAWSNIMLMNIQIKKYLDNPAVIHLLSLC